MTVAELILELSKLPHHATVMREGGEFKDDERKVSRLIYRKEASLGVWANSVLIK